MLVPPRATRGDPLSSTEVQSPQSQKVMLAFRKASEVALEVPAYQQICEKEKLKQRRCCKLLNMRKVRLRRQIEKLEKVTRPDCQSPSSDNTG